MAKKSTDEIEIPIKINGLTQIKKDIKSLKGDLADAIRADAPEAEIKKISDAINALNEDLNDVNDTVKKFAGATDFEKISNAFSILGDELASLDFKGANETAKGLTERIKGLDPKTLATGLKDLGKTVLQLGQAFFQMGLKLLANPLFLIPAIVAAVLFVLYKLKDVVPIIGKAFDVMGKAIDYVIQVFKDLSDAIGLTTFGLEDNAKKAEENAKRVIAASERKATEIEKNATREIALAKAQGKNTLALEKQTNTELAKEANKQAKAEKAHYDALYTLKAEQARKAGKVFKASADEELVTSFNKFKELENQEKDYYNDSAILDAEAKKEALQKQKEYNQAQAQYLNAYNAAKIDIMSDGFNKDQAIIKENLRKQRNEVLANDKITREQQQTLIKLYTQKSNQDLNKAKKDEKKRLDDNATDRYQSERSIFAKINELQKDSFSKQRRALNDKFQQDYIDASADIKKRRALSAEQLKNKEIDDAYVAAEEEAFTELLAAIRAKYYRDDNQLFKDYQETNAKLIREHNANIARETAITDEERLKVSLDENTNYFNDLIKNEEVFAKKLIEISKQDLEDKVITEEEHKAKIEQINKDKANNIVKLEAAKNQKLKDLGLENFKEEFEKYKKLADLALQFGASLNELFKTNEDNRLHTLERNTDNELEMLDAKYQAEINKKGITEEQKKQIDKKYAKDRFDLELKLFNEEEKIKKKQFERDKALKLATTITATAAAVVESWKNTGGFPIGGWAAAGMLAIGLANIATIVSTKYQGGTPPTLSTTNGGGGSASSGGGFSTGAQGLAPNNQTLLVGNMQDLNTVGAPKSISDKQNEQKITVKAVVVESDITGSQLQIKKIEEGAGI